MDFSKTPNPYDFANPVTKPDMFFGRSEEMTEIRYYLDHARAADRPINIALLGDRAAGKTSILNMTEMEAKERGCCTTRVDLDEDDAKSQFLFFYKMLDGIFTAACQLNAFGGLKGRTYEAYLNTTSCLSSDEDKLFMPLLFPGQYALATRAGNLGAPVSDSAIKHDLVVIREELKRPTAILFDESNVLAQSRVLLEKLRNIFMNIPGYMLVLTGTQDLFPIMDDVFSPIVRQFKKINVKEFEKKEDVENCIRKPLQQIEIPLEVSNSEVNEIRDLSGGRPYEIQLICHLLFRRIQRKQASRMRLDLSVLEELRKELASSQDISGRKVLGAVMSLNQRQLQVLGMLTGCDGRATFDELWSLHYGFEGTGEFTRNQVEAEFSVLKSRGILIETDGKLHFMGDSFDTLYVKYFAAEQRIKVDIRPYSLEIALLLRILHFIRPQSDFNMHFGLDAWSQYEQTASLLASEECESDPFREAQFFVDELYFKMVEFRKRPEIPALFVSVSLSGSAAAVVITPSIRAKDDAIEKLRRNFVSIKLRLENTGGSLIADRRSLSVIGVDRLSEKVLRTENLVRRADLARKHAASLVGAWLRGDRESAALHAKLAYSYDPQMDAKSSNNVGYFLMVDGSDESAAEEMFQRAMEVNHDSQTKVLANYNLAILLAKRNELRKALTILRGCESSLKTLSVEDKKAACLLVASGENGRLELHEERDPDIAQTYDRALRILSTLEQGSSSS